MKKLHPRKITRYGWKPSLPGKLKWNYRPELDNVGTLTPTSDLRSGFPLPAYDQGQLGSCTANGWAAAFDFTLKKLGLTPINPSRLFIYYFERLLQGTVKQDSGATISDGAEILTQYGTCAESIWPYIISKFKSKPPVKDIKEALNNVALQYLKVDNTSLTAIKTSLCAGYPIVFGMNVYDSFESAEVAKTGIVPMPGKGEQLLGGHCNVICGHDDTMKIGSCTGAFLSRNSWGTAWGEAGYCWIPYTFLTNQNFSTDWVTLRQVK